MLILLNDAILLISAHDADDQICVVESPVQEVIARLLPGETIDIVCGSTSLYRATVRCVPVLSDESEPRVVWSAVMDAEIFSCTYRSIDELVHATALDPIFTGAGNRPCEM